MLMLIQMMLMVLMVFMVKIKRDIENEELTRPFFQAEMLRRREDCINDQVN